MMVEETVIEYFAQAMIVTNYLTNPGDNMTDTKVVEKILRTLTEKFNYIVCAVEDSKDIETLAIDELQISLMCHEHKLM